MSVQGYNKPSGYFIGGDVHGNKVEGETRMCVHCGYTWIYKAHDAQFLVTAGGAETVKHHTTRRGFCLSCNGLVCARPECHGVIACRRGKPLGEP